MSRRKDDRAPLCVSFAITLPMAVRAALQRRHLPAQRVAGIPRGWLGSLVHVGAVPLWPSRGLTHGSGLSSLSPSRGLIHGRSLHFPLLHQWPRPHLPTVVIAASSTRRRPPRRSRGVVRGRRLPLAPSLPAISSAAKSLTAVCAAWSTAAASRHSPRHSQPASVATSPPAVCAEASTRAAFPCRRPAA